MTFAVSGDAREDAARAIRAYNARPDGHGFAFQAEFDAAVAAIAADPRLYPPVEDGVPGREVREFYIARFRQRVIYLVTGDDVLVVAVVHATRRPEAWHRQLPPTT